MPFVEIVVALILTGLLGWFLNTRTEMAGQVRMILNVVLALIVVGIALWLVNTYIPMAGAIKGILNIVVVAAVCVGVLQAFGLWNGIVKFWSDHTSHR